MDWPCIILPIFVESANEKQERANITILDLKEIISLFDLHVSRRSNSTRNSQGSVIRPLNACGAHQLFSPARHRNLIFCIYDVHTFGRVGGGLRSPPSQLGSLSQHRFGMTIIIREQRNTSPYSDDLLASFLGSRVHASFVCSTSLYML